jgi:hypothetical protein
MISTKCIDLSNEAFWWILAFSIMAFFCIVNYPILCIIRLMDMELNVKFLASWWSEHE